VGFWFITTKTLVVLSTLYFAVKILQNKATV